MPWGLETKPLLRYQLVVSVFKVGIRLPLVKFVSVVIEENRTIFSRVKMKAHGMVRFARGFEYCRFLPRPRMLSLEPFTSERRESFMRLNCISHCLVSGVDASGPFKRRLEEPLGTLGHHLSTTRSWGESHLEVMKPRVRQGGSGMEFCFKETLTASDIIWRICSNLFVVPTKTVGRSWSEVR